MIPPSDTDVPQGKITQAEMIEMFGESMPFEARQLIADAPPDWTLAQMRQRLREIAAERNHRSSDTDVRELVERLRRGVTWSTGERIEAVVGAVNDPVMAEAADALESQLSHIAELRALIFEMDEHVNDCCGCLGHIDDEFRERINRAALVVSQFQNN